MGKTTNAAKGSPGPWRIGAPARGYAHSVLSDNDEVVADVPESNFVAIDDRANAMLIAAAPALYDACVGMFAMLTKMRGVDHYEMFHGTRAEGDARRAIEAAAGCKVADATSPFGFTHPA